MATVQAVVLKDGFVLDILNKTLKTYRDLISKLDSKVGLMTAESLKEYLLEQTGEIDFIQFGRELIAQLKQEADEMGEEGKRATARIFQTAIYSLMDYFRRERISINEITVEFLHAYERFLKGKRLVTREDQFGRPISKVMDGLSAVSLNTYLRTLRSLFNKARKRFNKPSLGIKKIQHYPFAEYMEQNGHMNYRLTTYSPGGPVMKIRTPYSLKPQKCICFVSNDYLNFSQHPAVKRAAMDGILKFGTGTGASPLIGGFYEFHEQLETATAKLFGRKANETVTFTTGYTANTAPLLSLLRDQDFALIDAGAHTSVREGLANVTYKTFKHNDLESAEHILRLVKDKYQTKMIIVDGVYSQDGDVAPLVELRSLADKYGAYLMVDDAHGIGVLGKTGRGALEHFGMLDKVDILTGTYSKTFGHIGGYVVSSPEIINYIKFQSRQQIFSSTATPAVCGILKGLELIDTEPQWQRQLWDNISYLKAGLGSLGFDLGTTCSAIIPVKIGDPHLTGDMGRLLLQAGIFTNPILYPAVARKDARIRMSIMATHTREHLDTTLNTFEGAAKSWICLIKSGL